MEFQPSTFLLPQTGQYNLIFIHYLGQGPVFSLSFFPAPIPPLPLSPGATYVLAMRVMFWVLERVMGNGPLGLLKGLSPQMPGSVCVSWCIPAIYLCQRGFLKHGEYFFCAGVPPPTSFSLVIPCALFPSV